MAYTTHVRELTHLPDVALQRIKIEDQAWCLDMVLVHWRSGRGIRSLCPELAVTQPIERDAIYRRRRFPRKVIEGCVRWYLTYRLSYRDLVALMAEWGVHVNHTTIMRWVHRYVPEYEKRWNRRAKPVGSSWRVDETYIRTQPKTGYLYRAVDKQGKTVESLFQTQRNRCGNGPFPQSGGDLRAPVPAQDYPGW
jgi:hypothetical protein